MATEFACSCGASFRVPDHLAGEWGRCPQCERALRAPPLPSPPSLEVPEPEASPFEVVRVDCHCGREVAAPLSRIRAGQARCPTCDRRLVA